MVSVLQFGHMIQVSKYSDSQRDNWNQFVSESRTNSFLHERSYMDYHNDRFEDYSLILRKDQKIVGLLPANIDYEKKIVSHGGLTFGGLITMTDDKPINTLHYFKSILNHLHEQGLEKLIYKQAPVFYNHCSQDEIEYAIFLAKGHLYRLDTSFAVDNSGKTFMYQERRRRAIAKANKLGIQIKEVFDFSEFWDEVLTPNLMNRFGVKPVHSLNEITCLAKNNPNKIRQFNAYLNGDIYAGTTIFETPLVAHAQYISAIDAGRKNGAIDLLFDTLITDIFKEKTYFDFGIVNENQGRSINRGLWDWKEGFGAKVYAHRFFEIETRNYANIVLD